MTRERAIGTRPVLALVILLAAIAGSLLLASPPASGGDGSRSAATTTANIAYDDATNLALVTVADAGRSSAVASAVVAPSGRLFASSGELSAPEATTAIRRVGGYLESVDDVIANPRLLSGRTPAEVDLIIGRTPGWRVEGLGQGSRQGQGWLLREYTSRGHATGRQIRWHPGGGPHGPDPYWRVIGYNERSGIIR